MLSVVASDFFLIGMIIYFERKGELAKNLHVNVEQISFKQNEDYDSANY